MLGCARTVRARVLNRARIAIVACSIVGRVGAESTYLAAIVCAGVAVVAVLGKSRSALAGHAAVCHSARVSVRAGAVDWTMAAASVGFTAVESARVTVIARYIPNSEAQPAFAAITLRARVSIVAGGRVWGEDTTRLAVAAVVRAVVGIVAEQGFSSRTARGIVASIPYRADVPVIARCFVRECFAPCFGVADVGRTRIVIVTR